MRKILIALALAASLAACATPQPSPLSATARGNVTGFATLAVFGTWEMELAPAYTRLAALLHNTARQLDAQRIHKATAIEIQGLADQARSHLDGSRRGSQTAPTLLQRAALAEAIRLMDRAESLLEH